MKFHIKGGFGVGGYLVAGKWDFSPRGRGDVKGEAYLGGGSGHEDRKTRRIEPQRTWRRRNPKYEARNPKQIQNANVRMTKTKRKRG